jgi:hypothetical protein
MDKQVDQTTLGKIMTKKESFNVHEGSKNQSDWESPSYNYEPLQTDQLGVDRIGYAISPVQIKSTITREFPPNPGSEAGGYVSQKDIEIDEPIEPFFPEEWDNPPASKFK